MNIDWVEYGYTDKVGGHGAINLLKLGAQTHAEFAKKAEVAPRTYDPHYDDEAVFARAHGELIAALSFERSAWQRTIIIRYAYVEPRWRKKGIHSMLYRHVEAIAKRDGYVNIARSVMASNTSMVKAILAQGGQPTYQEFTHRVADPAYVGNLSNKYELADPL